MSGAYDSDMTGALRNPTLRRWLPVIVLPPILLLDGVLSQNGDPVGVLSVVIAYVATLPLVLLPRFGARVLDRFLRDC